MANGHQGGLASLTLVGDVDHQRPDLIAVGELAELKVQQGQKPLRDGHHLELATCGLW
jgi:hypothetical protein